MTTKPGVLNEFSVLCKAIGRPAAMVLMIDKLIEVGYFNRKSLATIISMLEVVPVGQQDEKNVLNLLSEVSFTQKMFCGLCDLLNKEKFSHLRQKLFDIIKKKTSNIELAYYFYDLPGLLPGEKSIAWELFLSLISDIETAMDYLSNFGKDLNEHKELATRIMIMAMEDMPASLSIFPKDSRKRADLWSAAKDGITTFDVAHYSWKRLPEKSVEKDECFVLMEGFANTLEQKKMLVKLGSLKFNLNDLLESGIDLRGVSEIWKNLPVGSKEKNDAWNAMKSLYGTSV